MWRGCRGCRAMLLGGLGGVFLGDELVSTAGSSGLMVSSWSGASVSLQTLWRHALSPPDHASLACVLYMRRVFPALLSMRTHLHFPPVHHPVCS